MIDLRIDIDTLPVSQAIARAANKQIPFAIALALTETARRVEKAEIKVMRQRFDRPTRYTLNSLMVQKATKTRQQARVWMRDWSPKGTPAQKYLNPQVYGGERAHKRSERALIAIGAMKPDEYAVPAAGARIDAYGNMSRGQIVQILSALRAFSEQGYSANRTSSARSQRKRRGSDYFAGDPGGGGRGVWQRVSTGWGEAIRPVLLFTESAPKYRKRLPFQQVAENVSRKYLQAEFIDALDYAIRTAK